MNRILNLLILLVLSVSVSFAIGGKALEKQTVPIDREIVGSEQELMQPASDVVYENPVAAFKQPLAGTYTIGVGGDFPMLRNAILYLNANGISGNVTFLFTDAAYTDTGITILNFPNPDSYTVTFKPAPGVVSSIYFSGGASLAGFRYGLHFQTASNIVWDGSNSGGTDRSLTIQMDTTIIPRSNAIIVRRASKNLTFKNLNIIGYRNIGQGGLDVVRFDNQITGTPGPQMNITIENCLIKQGGGGIFIRGQNGTNFDDSYTIRNNFLGGGSATNINEHLQFSAIWTENVKNVIIEGNEINGIRTAPAGGSPVALNFRLGSADVVASYNKISNIVNLAGAARPLVVIFGGSGALVPYKLTAKLFNNMIYDIHNFGTGAGGRAMDLLFGNPTAPPYGNATGTGSIIEVYHNTFHLVMGPTEGVGFTAFVWDGNFLGAGTTVGHYDSIIAYNNIYSIVRGAGAVRHFLWFGEGAPGNLRVDMNYNLYYDNTGSFFAQAPDPWPTGGGVMLPTLQDWTNHTGNDANSKFENPEFVSPVDAHISTVMGVVSPADQMGTTAYTYVDDIDKQLRANLTPVDVGADAFIPVPWDYDALPISILSPYVGGVPTGYPIPIAVRVRNNSINTFQIPIKFEVFDKTGTTLFFTATEVTEDLVVPYTTVLYNFEAKWTPAVADTYLLVATTELVGDQNPANNVISRNQVVKNYVVVGDISTTPYFEDFEGGPKTAIGWETEVLANKSEWVLGNPTKFGGAYSGVNAWYVGVADTYTVNWIAALNSPYFVFSPTDKPIISFKHIFSIEDDWDGVIVQYTEDFGATWNTLGEYNDPNGKNWYNEDANTFIFGYPPGGFSATNNLYPDDWDYAQLKAYELAGKLVRLRFVFGSDAYVVDIGYAMDDFGIANASSIAGLKWYDKNKDGVKDLEEAVLEGWTINLTGDATDSKVTDSEGEYEFTDLFDGNYVVSEELKSGWVNTYPAGGSYNITLDPGQSVVDKNFGNYWATATIAGMKWNDLNANGVKEAEEPGLDGWTINLAGPVSGSTVTAGGGLYAFNNLTEGTYTVSEVVQSGWKKTYPATVHTVEITTDGQVVDNINFGNFKYATISGIVYKDINKNGVKEASEPGIDGIVVNLTGPMPGSTTTSGGGLYSFLADFGTNTVAAVPPLGKYITAPAGGQHNINVNSSGLVFTDKNFGISTVLDFTKFRSFLPEDIVAVDIKGKVPKAVKRKPDKVEFEIDFTVPAGGPFNKLHLEWGSAPITGFPFIVMKDGDTLESGVDYTLTPAIDGKAKKFDLAFQANLEEDDVITIHAHAAKGKEQKGKYWWLPATKPTKLVMGPFTLNQPRLPMPSYANLIEEIYADGAFASDGGLLIGTARLDSPKAYGWVLMAKPGDVQKSLRDKSGIHTGGPKFFDVFENSNKPLVKMQKTLPPSKHNNKLFAELVALKLAIAASATEHTELGFGELVYDDTVSALASFNGMQIKDIFAQASAAMTSRSGDANLYYQIVRKLNEAFAGPLDTVSFASSTVLTGVKNLTQVPFLRINWDAVIARITPVERKYADVPEIFELAQNYPNPFNPTTTIQFILPEDAIVTLKVYNILGQEVATLANKELFTEGMNEVEFDAGNLASGIYFYQLTAEGVGENAQKFSQVKKMVLMK